MSEDVAEVRCGATFHRIALLDGDLVLLDHDETAERVLETLGGEVTGCPWLARAWREPTWSDAVACLLRDDKSAAALAAGRAAILARDREPALPRLEFLERRVLATIALMRLPAQFRRRCGERALEGRADAWRAGSPLQGDDRATLQRHLEPVLSRRLRAEDLELPPRARPVRARFVAPAREPGLSFSRGAWEARIPIDAVPWLASTTDPIRPRLERRPGASGVETSP